jgi:hypothetical protein
VVVVRNNLFLLGQPDLELRYRQLGPFIVDEHNIEKHRYKLRLPSIARLHPVFHINNSLTPCSCASLNNDVPVATPEDDDKKFDVSQSFVVRNKPLIGLRGEYLLFMARILSMTTFHLQDTGWTSRYTVQRRYVNFWRRPNGARLQRLKHT